MNLERFEFWGVTERTVTYSYDAVVGLVWCDPHCNLTNICCSCLVLAVNHYGFFFIAAGGDAKQTQRPTEETQHNGDSLLLLLGLVLFFVNETIQFKTGSRTKENQNAKAK